jgi:hypothetical protein
MADGLSGTRVRVCCSDGFWYLGAIDSYHEPTGKYRISLDDGDRCPAPPSSLAHAPAAPLLPGLPEHPAVRREDRSVHTLSKSSRFAQRMHPEPAASPQADLPHRHRIRIFGRSPPTAPPRLQPHQAFNPFLPSILHDRCLVVKYLVLSAI